MSNLQKLVMGNKGVNLQKMYSCKKKYIQIWSNEPYSILFCKVNGLYSQRRGVISHQNKNQFVREGVIFYAKREVLTPFSPNGVIFEE